MCKKETQEVYKLKCYDLQYKVNEEKGVVTAIETFVICIPGCTVNGRRDFTTVGVAKVNKEAGEEFNVEIGKKLARAKAEKEAFVKFKNITLRHKKFLLGHVQKTDNTIEKMKDCIQHQKDYIKSF